MSRSLTKAVVAIAAAVVGVCIAGASPYYLGSGEALGQQAAPAAHTTGEARTEIGSLDLGAKNAAAARTAKPRAAHIARGAGRPLPPAGRRPHDPAQPLHVRPSRKPPRNLFDEGNGDAGPLSYGNGPVMPSTVTYAIYWEPSALQDGTPSGVADYYNYDIARFFQSVGNSALYNVVTQYYQVRSADNALEYVTNNSQWGDYIIDTNPYPPSQCDDPVTGTNCLTDSQIRREIDRVMQVKGWSGGPTHMFFVFTDYGEGSYMDDIPDANDYAYLNPDMDGGYCAYHYYFNDTRLNQDVIYANMPYSMFAGIGEDIPCGELPASPNHPESDTEISTTSHELFEAVTDWDGRTGWGGPGGEIADECNRTYGDLSFDNGFANESMNGLFFTAQEEWSNKLNQCEQGSANYTAPTLPPPTVQFTAGSVVSATSVPVRVAWSATDRDGIQRYLVYYKVDSGSWQLLANGTTTSATLATVPGHSYDVEVMAEDNAGNWDDRWVHKTFSVSLYDDGSTAEQSSGTWTRYTLGGSIGGSYLAASGAGAWRSFRFTGSDVAWVAPKFATAGQARPWYDNTWDSTVDLYSATTAPARVIYPKHFAQAGTHTIGFQVVGTSGRPWVGEDGFVVIR